MSQKISAVALAEQRAIIKRQRKVSAVSKGNSVSAPWTRGQVAPKRSPFGTRAHYAHATEPMEYQAASGFAVKGRIAAGKSLAKPEQQPKPDSAVVRQDPTIRRMRATFNALLINQHGV